MVIRWVSVLLLGLLCPACLGEAYKIDQQELRRLAAQPANERGNAVRATQLFGHGDHPRTERERSRRERPPTATAEVVTAGVVAAGSLVSSARRRRRSRNSGSGGRAAGTALAVVAGVALIAGVTVVGGVLALGVEEARRFEGSLELHPTHALYLRRHNGRMHRPMWRRIRLTNLTPELAEWADSAIVDERDGHIEQLSRARLDRRGLFTSLYGAFGMTDDEWVGGVRLHAGAFPIQHLGLLAIVDFEGGGGHLQTRVGGEVQVFAPPLARFHMGAYVESGSLRARVKGDGLGVLTSPFVGGGALLQLDVMTRLSFDVRGGMWWAPDGIRPTFAVGFSVY